MPFIAPALRLRDGTSPPRLRAGQRGGPRGAVGGHRAGHRRAVARKPVRRRRAVGAVRAGGEHRSRSAASTTATDSTGCGSWLPRRGVDVRHDVDRAVARRPERHLRRHGHPDRATTVRSASPTPSTSPTATARASCPLGTTAYAWTHQPERLQERTLATLAASPFRKLRMCVFPKSYLFNTNEPERYPFARDDSGRLGLHSFRPGSSSGTWSSASSARRARHRGRPDPVPPVRPLGILRDARPADDRYVRYLVRRLGAHRPCGGRWPTSTT